MAADVSLGSLFENCRAVYEKREDPSCTPEQLASAYADLQRCADAVDRLGLFSVNEEIDDVPTSHLKYLLLPFYAAMIAQCRRDLERPAVVAVAQSHLRALLSSCDRMAVLTPEARRAARAILSGAADTVASDGDLASRRMDKIARFKRDRALAVRVAELRARRAQTLGAGGGGLRHSAGVRASTLMQGKEGKEDGDEGSGGDLDEAAATAGAAGPSAGHDGGSRPREDDEDDRELELLIIESSINTALSEAALLSSEAALLRQKPVPGDDSAAWGPTTGGQEPSGDASDGARSARPNVTYGAGAGAARAAALELGGERTRLAAGVFRAGHALPTYTVEQAAEYDMQFMQPAGGGAGKGVKPGRRDSNDGLEDPGDATAEHEHDSDDDDDDAVLKARRWDDWKDQNPAGKGNSKLRPCG